MDKQKLIEKYVLGREKFLVESYIVHGPVKTCDYLGVLQEEWQLIFDYLVFEKNLIYKCIIANIDFFIEIYVKDGGLRLRSILEIDDKKYNQIWEQAFDYIAIANDSLIYHVMENREKYLIGFNARGGSFLRKVLGIWKEKYNSEWEKILNFLLNTVCNGIFEERNFEEGLFMFSRLINGTRVHRTSLYAR